MTFYPTNIVSSGGASGNYPGYVTVRSSGSLIKNTIVSGNNSISTADTGIRPLVIMFGNNVTGITSTSGLDAFIIYKDGTISAPARIRDLPACGCDDAIAIVSQLSSSNGTFTFTATLKS